MNFRASWCEPSSQDIVELGRIDKDSIIDKFESIDWSYYLQQMITLKQEEIYYSPSLEIENKDTRHGLNISAVGDPDNYEFYIFYKRPKKVKLFFGLKERMDDNYMTDKTGQSRQDVLDCLNALLRNDTEFLADRIGR